MPNVNDELDAALLVLRDLDRSGLYDGSTGSVELEGRVHDILERNKGRVQFLAQQRRS